MPLTVGPGSIAVALTLGSNAREESHMQLIQSALISTIGIVLIGITIYLCYRFSDGLERLLGQNGTSIVVRLSAFILVCIGIQIMFNGADEFYTEMVKNAQSCAGDTLKDMSRRCGRERIRNFLSCGSRRTSPAQLFPARFPSCGK